MDRKAFLDQEPPPGYVAGIGRGATGFTTSADTARVKFESDFGNEDDISEFGAPEEGILFKTSNRTNDDEEADRIYEDIDRRLQRKLRQLKDIEIGVVEIEAGSGVIRKEFSLFKRDLAKVSMGEWATLPDVGDLTRKNKRQRLLDQQSQRTYAAPDVLIAGARNTLNLGKSHTTSDDALALNTSGVNVADIEQWEESNDKVANLEKSRLIFASLRRTEPHKADSWIASARLEEQAKEFDRARALIREGCTKVPHNANVWLESVRIHRNSNEGTKKCKAILNEALRLNSDSERLWFLAEDLENLADVVSRKKILMKALEYLPENARLWKALIDLEVEDGEKVRILQKATEICPGQWDLWLNLINLSTYDDAKSALNRARRQLPKEHKVWITALKIEERENPKVVVLKLVLMLKKGITELQKNSATYDVEIWLDESVEADAEGFDKTCHALIENVSFLLSNNDDKLLSLILYAEQRSGAVSLYIYQQVIKEYPHDVGSWVQLFKSLKSVKKEEKQLYDYYEEAVNLNPKIELFHLMFAKDKWVLSGDVDTAKRILESASKVLPRSEKIWLARVKLEVRTSNYESGYKILKQAINDGNEASLNLWFKYIHLIQFCVSKGMQFVSPDDLLKYSEEVFDLFPDHEEFYIQRSEIFVDLDDIKSAREILSIGSRKCPSSVKIWCSLADLDIGLGVPARARSLLDTAILQNLESDILWQKRIALEINQNDMVTARQMVSKCLKQFPSSPRIWLQNLSMILKLPHRKNVFLDALKLTQNSTLILLGIGVFFWMEGKFPKAKIWFDRAINSDKKYGDAWAWSYCFLSKNGLEEEKNQLLDELVSNFDDIDGGQVWTSVVDDYRNLDKVPSQIIEMVAEKLLGNTA